MTSLAARLGPGDRPSDGPRRARRRAGPLAGPGAADSESILFRLRPFESVRQSVSDYSVSLSSLESSDFSNRDLKSGLGPSARAEVSDFLLILQNGLTRINAFRAFCFCKVAGLGANI